jgi:hypothetical protein
MESNRPSTFSASTEGARGMMNRCGNERRVGSLKANSPTALEREKRKQAGRNLLHGFHA